MSDGAAETVKNRIAELNTAALIGTGWKNSTAPWVAGCDRGIREKLAELGLLPKEAAAPPDTLLQFIDRYIAGRGDVKPATTTIYGNVRRNLVKFLGAATPLAAISPGELDGWRRWLTRPKAEGGEGLAENTAHRRCKVAKQFFRAALRRRLITENPCADMKGLSMTTNRP